VELENEFDMYDYEPILEELWLEQQLDNLETGLA
jgi:hypothetical protein